MTLGSAAYIHSDIHTHVHAYTYGVVVIMLVRVVDNTSVFLQLRISLNAQKITAYARKLVMLVAVSFGGVVAVMFVRLVDRRRCRCQVRTLG